MNVKIYQLKDPRNNQIKYIGRTSKVYLNDRLCEHISKAKYHLKYKRKATHLINWIKELLLENKKPIIEFVEEIEGWEESHIRERELIQINKEFHNLTNLDDKGMGNHNHYVPEDTKKKISDTLKSKYRNGMKNYGGLTTKKKVYQFNKDGEFIKEYESVTQASIELNICDVNISSNCSNFSKNKTVKGFIFSYKKEFPKECLINNKLVKIKIINILTNEIYSFDSLIECTKKLNIPKTCLYLLIKNNNRIYNGKYKYYNERKSTENCT